MMVIKFLFDSLFNQPILQTNIKFLPKALCFTQALTQSGAGDPSQ